MKMPLFPTRLALLTLSFTLISAIALHGKAKVNTAEDDAHFGNYNNGWHSGQKSGGGFGPWVLQCTDTNQDFRTWAGFFIASADKPELQGIAHHGKAWGIYANGQRFEEAVAFRSFNRPLEANETFSVFFEFDGFDAKWGNDSLRPGRTGVALRMKDAPDTLKDYREGARVIIETTAASPNYILSDEEREWDTQVRVDKNGALFCVTPRGFYGYDLEIKTLSDGQVHRFRNRKLGGKANKKIENLAIFALNTETHDVYFSGLQVASLLPPADDAVRNMMKNAENTP